jgi:hypothetical protein
MAITNASSSSIAFPNQAVMNILGHKKERDQSTTRSVSKITGFNEIAGFQMPPDGSVKEGGRNNFLISAAGYFRSQGLGGGGLFDVLNLVNQAKCDPPVDLNELDSVAVSASRYSQPTAQGISGTLKLSDGLITLLSNPSAPRPTVWEELLFRGKYAALAGPGGVSKTMLAIGLAAQVALGEAWANKTICKGASLLILGEEDNDEVGRRFNAVVANRFAAEQAEVVRLVRSIPAAGVNIQLVQLAQGAATPTQLGDRIVGLAAELATETGDPVQLIVLDHARLVGAGDSNDASHVTELTRVLTYVAQQTNACVLLIGHSPKSVHGKAAEELSQADFAGSGAYVDNARSAFLMTTLKKEEAKRFGVPETARSQYVRFDVIKNNYGPTGEVIYFLRRHDPVWQVSVLEPVKLQPKQKTPVATNTRKVLDDLNHCIAAGKLFSRSGFTQRRSGKDGPIGVSEKELRELVEGMLANGLLAERPPTDDERRLKRISSNVRTVLVPTELAGEQCPAS